MLQFGDKIYLRNVMQSIENKIKKRLYEAGRGSVFSKKDFSSLGQHKTIDKALSRLLADGFIRRVIPGIYDYPKFSELLKREMSPDIDQVARALARKFGWSIQVSGNTALNVLGLSTQVPAKYLYYSNGRSRAYKIGNIELEFEKTALSDIGFKYSESDLVVQAVKALDKKTLTENEKQKIRDYFSPEKHARILKDTRYTTSWVYEVIKSVFKNQT